MRNIVLVTLCGIAAAGIFITWRQKVEGRPASAAILAGAVDRIALRWATEGPALEEHILTIALSGHYEGEDPMVLPQPPLNFLARLIKGTESGGFLRALQREPDTVVWPLGRMAPAEEEGLIDPFARILVKAGADGARVRIIAQGNAVGFAMRAAVKAAEGRPPGKPVVERILGVGINSKILKDRYGNLFGKAGRVPAVAEWVNIWSEAGTVARSVFSERWTPDRLEPQYTIRAWQRDSWPAIVTSVSRQGTAGLPKEDIIRSVEDTSAQLKARPALREQEDRRSGIEMILETKKKEEENAKRAQAKPVVSAEIFPLGDSGWATRRLTGFEYIKGHNLTAFWSSGGFRINIFQHRFSESGWVDSSAEHRCKAKGLTPVKAKHHGFPVVLCNGVTGRETGGMTGGHDYFTIKGKGYYVTVSYMYDPPSARARHMKFFTKTIEALYPL